MPRFLVPVLPLLALGALAPSAQAQVTQYSSQAAFNAATSGLTTFTFNGLAPANGQTYHYPSVTVQGVTLTAPAPGQGVFVNDPGYNGGAAGNPFNGSQYLIGVGTITVVLPAATTAFGADFAIYGGSSPSTITAMVNGTSFTFQAPGSLANTSVFAGFTSSVPITSLSFPSNNPALDYVSFGKGLAAVPETSTTVSLSLLLMLGGLMAVARRKKAAAV